MNEKVRENATMYIDRIHDKLFNYNNLLIGGFFALGQIDCQVPTWTIIFPLLNLCLLIFFDFKLLVYITNQASTTDPNSSRNHVNANWAIASSLLSVLSTLIVTITFVYYLI